MKKHKRRILAFLLALGVLTTLLAPALGAERDIIHIKTAQDLVSFSQNCSVDGWSVGKTVYLEADIDLGGSGFQSIPIFGGTFDGQGHTISGFSLTGSGDERGFFRYIQAGATVQNLTVSGTVSPSDRKDSIGGLVGVNGGRILNCSFQGIVKAGTNVGGLAGCNQASGQLINCTYSGTLLGEHYVGGIVGRNEGSVILCRNEGDINLTEVKTTVAIHEMSLSSIRSTETVPACTDIGGIAGASTAILQSCTNNGDVGYEHVGYNVGGIAGRQSGWLDSCINTGSVKGRKDVGGICGQMEPRLTLLFDSDDLDELWQELDTLQALMDQAISDAQGASDTISTEITGVSHSADQVKSAASDLSEAMTDWADGNIETVNDVSARISWTMDRLSPIADTVDSALDRLQDSVALAEDALEELHQMGELSEDAFEELRLALDRVSSSAGQGIAAAAQLRDAFQRLQNGLGDSGAMHDAVDDIRSALDGLTASFGLLSDAFGNLWDALGNLSGRVDETPEGDEAGSGWDGVLDALEELRAAAGEIQNALSALKHALGEPGDVAEDLFWDTLDSLASASEHLASGFHLLDQAAGHMETALESLDGAAPYGESAAGLLRDAAGVLEEACGQLRQADDTFHDVMTELAQKPEISFSPAGDALDDGKDALDDAMGSLSSAVQGLNDAMSASSHILLEDLRAINTQFGKVVDVLRNHSDRSETEDEEDLLEDVSDQATETDEDAGRITHSQNTGAVEGDVNVAGIVGSMAIEYDYDPEDDLTTSGDRSLSFRYQAAALTERCVNSGTVTGKKDYVGGIVGRMDLGTVSQCESYTPVESTGGDYVGGIAGAAWSTIRSCWSRCALAGTDYIGGVVGLGRTVTDCRSLVEIDEGSACLGAVLGAMEEDGQVSGNLFTHDTLGGIDGISYLSQAEPVDFETLAQGAPSAFTRFRLTFQAEGQVVETFDFSYGDALTQLPEIPAKEGCSASWPDLDYSCLTFSRTLEAEYTSYTTALTALGDPPQIVVQGTFGAGSSISASYADGTWTDGLGKTHTGQIYTVAVTDPVLPATSFDVQYKLPDHSSSYSVWVQTAAGWQQQQAERDGTYLVFRAEGDSVTFTVQETGGNRTAGILALCVGGAAAGLLIVLGIKKIRRAKGRK